ncbi:MAG: hypothetical protein IPP51_15145 [Bacteroidetes bacterium]|nr:hypothetical protein [Bacteroidota bacterium]
MENELIYFLNFKNENCNFKISVNNIHLLSDEKDGNYSIKIPVNNYLIPGVNYIGIDLLPLSEENRLRENAVCYASVSSRTPLSDQMAVVHDEDVFPEFNKLGTDEFNSPPKFSHSLSIVPPAFPKSKILTSDLASLNPIEDLPQFIEFNQYIYKLFELKKIKDILALIESREADLAYVNYQDSSKRMIEWEKTLNSLFEDANEELLPFDPKEFVPRIEFGGRLMSLVDEFGDCPIIYYNETMDVSNAFNFILGKTKETNKLKIVR